ncbi:MAG: hypothetical protein GEU94_20975 [Micromonosporaceae bacterium]|nr:hypothetical protein [Micromonosporaceae bacterium]
MESLLEPVGLGADESLAYQYLLARPRLTATELADVLGMPAARTRRALAALGEAGLVTRIAATSPARYTPAPPDLAIDGLALRRQQELERLRARARELTKEMADPPRGGPSDLVELVEGAPAVLQHLSRMQLSAQQEVCIVDCPPYLTGAPADNPEELQALRRGVRYRALYHAPCLATPGRMEDVLSWVTAGEEARALPDVHLKMIIVDQQIAMIPLSFAEAETGVRILIHTSPLLSVLITCFDLLWEQAAPLAAAPGPANPGAATADLAAADPGAAVIAGSPASGPDDQDRELLAMLAAGMKDRAMARALGVTERTVTRRITLLMRHLGSETRFQAALQAARRGWL